MMVPVTDLPYIDTSIYMDLFYIPVEVRTCYCRKLATGTVENNRLLVESDGMYKYELS